MSANLNVAFGRLPYPTRFVLVNNRIPRTDQHCALCGGIIDRGYVRDSQTRLIYCDAQCFAAGSNMTMSPIEERGRKVS
jgi:hypothetical protein